MRSAIMSSTESSAISPSGEKAISRTRSRSALPSSSVDETTSKPSRRSG